ncbi:MAG: LrgB family protein [Cyanobacteria bacterium P01_H01_bin.130]
MPANQPDTIFHLWVYLSTSPLLGLTTTLAVFIFATWLYQRSGKSPLLNPVPVAVAIIIGLLLLTQTPYETYFEGAQFIHFQLGPATVALAVALYQQLPKLRKLWLPVSIALVTGVVTAVLSGVAIARLLGGSRATLISIAPKSVTTPVAMGIAEQTGGLPSLTAAFVVITGIVGALTGTTLLRWLNIRDDSVKGIAMGITSHGMGTARSFQVSPEMGAFAGLAMAIASLITAILLPWLLGLIGLQ